ncbi:tyrosine-type recombinase/integrase [Dactylosporangium cerinum]|uniref:tyrosine-type recombinase/integrase n=1 Tax=Dactylosporangium cerinum TaxID=1434730 RepID=UPI0036D21088
MVLAHPGRDTYVSTVPTAIRPDVRKHLHDFTGAAADSLIFSGVTGAPLRRSNFQRTTDWTVAVTACGLPGFHFHDLRHTGNTLASRTGASLADLMARMGHSSTRAALIYQHAAHEQDRSIADALSAQITRQCDRARNGHARKRQRPA